MLRCCNWQARLSARRPLRLQQEKSHELQLDQSEQLPLGFAPAGPGFFRTDLYEINYVRELIKSRLSLDPLGCPDCAFSKSHA